MDVCQHGGLEGQSVRPVGRGNAIGSDVETQTRFKRQRVGAKPGRRPSEPASAPQKKPSANARHKPMYRKAAKPSNYKGRWSRVAGYGYAASPSRSTAGMSLRLGADFCGLRAVASSAAATAEIPISR